MGARMSRAPVSIVPNGPVVPSGFSNDSLKKSLTAATCGSLPLLAVLPRGEIPPESPLSSVVMDDVAAAPSGAPAAREPGPLRLGRAEFPPERRLVMAIVNRTPDSFYRPGISWDEGAALEQVHTAVAEGADILDVGGVPAKPGPEVTVTEEIRRVVPFIAAVRAACPGLVISVDTWRHESARAVCEAGADLVNDTWGGWDPQLAEVAAEYGAGLVCSHAGGAWPRTRPHRVSYRDVMADVL